MDMQAAIPTEQAATMAGALEPQVEGAAPQGAPLTFNGVVTYEGQQLQVTNGKVSVGGEKFIVSNSGELVFNAKTRKFVGSIIDGVFMPATPELVQQLKEQGKL